MPTKPVELESNGGNADGGQPIQPAATPALDASLVNAVAEQLAKDPAFFGRVTQSAKDRTVNEVRPQLEGFKAQLAEYQRLVTEGGLKPEIAMEFMALKQQAGPQAQAGNPAQAAQSGGNQTPATPAATPFDPVAVASALGLDVTDAEFRMHTATGWTPESMLAYAVKQKTPVKASPAQVFPQSSSSAAPLPDDDIESLTAKIAAYSREPSKYMKEMTEASKKLRELLTKPQG